ncbi:MAG TPA: ABC transporter permease [Bryobacteraceae bacterium]|jgi:putative ABC transport system permease protein|nr:ABC transporter permease [Bryobacteraceae bacterium]
MRLWNRLLLRVRGGSELADEIRLHREMLEEEFVREGMSRKEAAHAAARQFGNAGAAADWSRDEWSFPRFDALWRDLVFALRLMWRQPLVTAAAVLTVAFGVGANTAMLSVLETVLLNPLGMGNTGGVMVARVHIDKLRMKHSTDSAVEFAEIHTMTDAFASAAAVEGRAWTYQTGGEVTRLLGRAVTPEFFEVFGVSPALGRFLNSDDRESVVLSYEMWQAQFGGSRDVLGRTLMLDDTPQRIVGVAPRNFRFPPDAAAWSPLILSAQRMSPTQRGNNMNLMVFARLRPGVTPTQASGRVSRYVDGLFSAPGGGDLKNIGYGIDLDPFSIYLAGEMRQPLWMLSIAALVVLLTACANVAGLLLTRSASRRKEIAIRLAMGATKGQIVRQLLLESTLLGGLGGLAGVGLAKIAIEFVKQMALPGRQVLAMVSLDAKMLLYGLAIALASGMLFGLAPAVQLLRDSQTSALARSRRRWFQDIFVSAEVAGAFALVVVTGLLLRSLWNVEQVQLGFQPHHVATAYFTKPKNDPTFEQRLQAALAGAPGVESAALAYPVPFTTGGLTSGFGIRNRQRLPGEPEWHGEAYFVSPGYLQTLRIPLLRGRNLVDSDDAGAPTVCLIDRNLADRFFANQDPIGQQIAMYKGWAQIVGVVSNVRADGLEEETRPVVYYSLAQIPYFAQSAAIVRSAVPVGNLLRDVIHRTNPAVPVFDAATMDERIGGFLGIRRVLAGLLLAFGGIALLLAAIGIYGVIAQVVSEQTREVGVRMALGARAGQILALFMRQGLYAGGIGLIAGLVATLLVQRWVSTLLYQVRALDAATLSVATAGIVAVLLAAVWLPARRASKIDPQNALRHE